MNNAVYVENLVVAIDRIENAPVSDGVLGHAGQVGSNGFVPEIFDVGREPFGLVEQTLRHGFVHCGEIGHDVGFERKPKPGHRALPPQSKLLGHLVSRHARL